MKIGDIIEGEQTVPRLGTEITYPFLAESPLVAFLQRTSSSELRGGKEGTMDYGLTEEVFQLLFPYNDIQNPHYGRLDYFRSYLHTPNLG